MRVRQADFDRKNDLAISRSGTAADRDTSMANLIQAKQILEFVKWQQATVKVKLGGGPDTTIDQFPDYMQANAAVDDAERNLRNTKVLAPIDGVATQVPRSSSDAWRRPASRCSRSSPTRACGSTPIRRNRT